GNSGRHAAEDRGLPRRRLPFAALHDVAHDHFVERRRVDSRASHRGLHRVRTKLWRRQRAESAEKAADGSACAGDNDGGAGRIGHLNFRVELNAMVAPIAGSSASHDASTHRMRDDSLSDGSRACPYTIWFSTTPVTTP